MPDLEDRLTQLESSAQISQLVARYAVAYDARDLGTLAELYAPEVREAALSTLRAEVPAGVAFHLTAEPVLTFDGMDAAHGVVCCRAESEAGDEWIVAGLRYHDSYVRRDGSWYLAARTTTTAYSADVLTRP